MYLCKNNFLMNLITIYYLKISCDTKIIKNNCVIVKKEKKKQNKFSCVNYAL